MIRLKERQAPAPSEESARTTTLITADKQRDREIANALNYFYLGACTGSLTPAEVKGRFQEKYDSEGILILDGKQVRGSDGYRVSRNFTIENFVKLLKPKDVSNLLIEIAEQRLRGRTRSDEATMTLNASRFYITQIATRRISGREIRGRLSQSFNQDGVLVVDNEKVRGIDGYFAGRRFESDRFAEILTKRTALPAFLISIANSFSRQAAELVKAKENVDAVKYLLNGISSQSFTSREIEGRFQGRFDKDGVLLFEGVQLRGKDGYRLSRQFLADRYYALLRSAGLTNQFTFLAKYTCSSDGRVEIGSAIAQYLKSDQSDSSKGRLIQILDLNEDKSLSSAVLKAVDEIKDFERKNSFIDSFLTAFEGQKDLTTLGALLGRYEIIDEKDQKIRTEFVGLLSEQRRIERMRAALTALDDGRPTVEGAIDALSPILGSRDEADRSCVAEILKICYECELAYLTNEVASLTSPRLTAKDSEQFLENFPIRPTIGSIDYRKEYEARKQFLSIQSTFAAQYRRLMEVNQIREEAQSGSYPELVNRVSNFNFGLMDDPVVQQQVFDEVRVIAGANSPGEFDRLFANDIQLRLNQTTLDTFDMPILGKNIESMAFLAEQFRTNLNPLLQSLRNDPSSRQAISAYLDSDRSRERKAQFEISLAELKRDRGDKGVSQIEESYIQSVEVLSRMNPALVAMMSTAPDDTLAYLRAHFRRLSATTLNGLQDGDYIPVILVGFGPHGIAAMGEIARLHPELARNTLIIDRAELPGGPFSIPAGPAWELNSANQRGKGIKLPDRLNGGRNEEETVRAWGSPFRWYPGERSESTVRGGSINTIVDYLPNPDTISGLRYPTNKEFSLVAQAHAALVASKLALRTQFMQQTRNPDQGTLGDKLVQLDIQSTGTGRKSLRLRTDAVLFATGFGEESFGFPLSGSKAEQVMKSPTPDGFFPRLSTTLTAFRSLIDETGGRVVRIGETVVIWGDGNSADTLLENLGSLFSQTNPIVREITKIYVISKSGFSKRPRYLRILDLKPRNGSGNLVEEIIGRVTDVDFSPQDRTRLIFLDESKRPFRTANGQLLEGDHGIAAAGFRSQLSEILGSYVGENDPAKFLVPLTLPTNRRIVVGETLKSDENVLLFGTAAKPNFGPEKRVQLPGSASNALGRVGGTNAVALGFRIPETQAAIRRWVWSREFELPAQAEKRPTRIAVRSVQGKSKFLIPFDRNYLEEQSISVKKPDRLASALLGYLLKIEKRTYLDIAGNPLTGTSSLEIRIENSSFSLTSADGDRLPGFSPEFVQVIGDVLRDKFLSAYLIRSIEGKRREQKLTLDLEFQKGDLRFSGTFVE